MPLIIPKITKLRKRRTKPKKIPLATTLDFVLIADYECLNRKKTARIAITPTAISNDKSLKF